MRYVRPGRQFSHRGRVYGFRASTSESRSLDSAGSFASERPAPLEMTELRGCTGRGAESAALHMGTHRGSTWALTTVPLPSRARPAPHVQTPGARKHSHPSRNFLNRCPCAILLDETKDFCKCRRQWGRCTRAAPPFAVFKGWVFRRMALSSFAVHLQYSREDTHEHQPVLSVKKNHRFRRS